ncbi:MAG TPA: ABC transporter substrate-binding protein [Candidatus Acidoferrales bacterium]|nr:ABC transporter substrate-binding protein [Candidatus Acidoferrales bacterium]
MKKIIVSLLAAAVLLLPHVLEAQQPAKMWRIGVLVSDSPELNAPRAAGLRQGLKDFGYEEGKNIVLEYRYAHGNLSRLPELAADLVRSNVDLIVVGGTRVAVAAHRATKTIPIVVAGAGDLVAAGLVRNFRQPGGNVTGVSRISPDVIGTRVQLLKEALPKTARVGVVSNPENPAYEGGLKHIDLDVRAWGMSLQTVPVKSVNQLESAFASAKTRVDALFVMADALLSSSVSQIVELAAKNRLPAMYDRADFVEAGGLMSYGVNLVDLSRRAGWYVDQIFQGAKPGSLPLIEPTKFELLVNLKAADQLGITISPSVLGRADKVIK